MTISEKVAYLKGLSDGLGVDDTTKEGKMLKAITDILEDMALTVEDIEDTISELTEQVDEIDEDLGDVEEAFYGLDDDEDDDDCELYEVVCPTCKDSVCIDEEMVKEGEMDCPNCGERLEFDFDCAEDETEE